MNWGVVEITAEGEQDLWTHFGIGMLELMQESGFEDIIQLEVSEERTVYAFKHPDCSDSRYYIPVFGETEKYLEFLWFDSMQAVSVLELEPSQQN